MIRHTRRIADLESKVRPKFETKMFYRSGKTIYSDDDGAEWTSEQIAEWEKPEHRLAIVLHWIDADEVREEQRQYGTRNYTVCAYEKGQLE